MSSEAESDEVIRGGRELTVTDQVLLRLRGEQSCDVAAAAHMVLRWMYNQCDHALLNITGQ